MSRDMGAFAKNCKEGYTAGALRFVGDVNAPLDGRGQCGIHLAAEGGHIQTCQALVSELGADVNKGEEMHGLTALHIAVMKDSVPLARMLAKTLFADLERRDKYGQTPLHNVKSTDMVKLLVGELGVMSVNEPDRQGNVPLRTIYSLGPMPALFHEAWSRGLVEVDFHAATGNKAFPGWDDDCFGYGACRYREWIMRRARGYGDPTAPHAPRL